LRSGGAANFFALELDILEPVIGASDRRALHLIHAIVELVLDVVFVDDEH